MPERANTGLLFRVGAVPLFLFGAGTQHAPKRAQGAAREAKSTQKGTNMTPQGLKNELKNRFLGF